MNLFELSMKIAPISGVFGSVSAVLGSRAWDREVMIPVSLSGFFVGILIYVVVLGAVALAMNLSDNDVVKNNALLKISIRVFLVLSGLVFCWSPFLSAWICHVAAPYFF